MDEFIQLMERLDHGGTLVKYALLGTVVYKVFRLAISVHDYFETFGSKLDNLQRGQLTAAEERNKMKNLLTDQGLRLQYLEQKYAGIKVGETVIPEDTEERKGAREKVKQITGSFPALKPEKKKGS